MKYLAILGLMLSLGATGVYAQSRPVHMTFSGSNVATTINLLAGTVTDEEVLAGYGTLGAFTFRELHADLTSPQPSTACSGPTHLYFSVAVGAGVFRFQDGSLLTVRITEGALCADLAAGAANLAVNYQIAGGTGRFQGASGTLTLTATLAPLLRNASNGPELLTNTGKFEGTIFGVGKEFGAWREPEHDR